MLSLCRRLRSLTLDLWTGLPSKKYSSSNSPSSIPRIASSVDFPDPEGPMIVTKSPSAMSSVICRRTHVRPPLYGYDFSTFSIRIIAAPAVSCCASSMVGSWLFSPVRRHEHANHAGQCKRLISRRPEPPSAAADARRRPAIAGVVPLSGRPVEPDVRLRRARGAALPGRALDGRLAPATVDYLSR